MANNASWDNVPNQLLEIIGCKIDSLNDSIRFSAVSKTWQSVMSERWKAEKTLMTLSPETPLLLLAEEVQGTLLSCDIDEDEDSGDEDMGVGQEESGDNWVERYQYMERFYQLKISVGTARGIYSLSTGKLYTVDLPEAAGKAILGIKKGWLLTLGKSFEINLLHPLLRQEISLPTMRVVGTGAYCSFEGVYMNYVKKAAMSEVQPNENGIHNDRPDPIIMIIYGKCGDLGCARPGDEVWTKVDVPRTGTFTDIAYCRGKFYSVNRYGSIFVCHIDDDFTNGRLQATGTKIAQCPLIKAADTSFGEKYLVESGCDLWLVVRLRRTKFIRSSLRAKYRTTSFFVWKLKEDVSEDGLKTQYTWIQKNNLEKRAFFIGRNSSTSLPSSGCISPNCIYFTDDARNLYFPDGGGHDMGVYNVESGTIVPHFQGKSIHPVSPPLWCI